MKACSGIAMPCDGDCMKAGYSYVPPQRVDFFYDYESALMSGTVFPDLAIPKGKYGPKENFS